MDLIFIAALNFMDSILTTVQNFYNYIIYVSGIIAIVFLIKGGFLYLTSTGKPEQVEKAKKQILAVFWGGIIILSSYIILSTINPRLVEFESFELEEIYFNPLEVPPLETRTPTLLEKVREIAEKIRGEVLPGMEGSSSRILSLTDNCSCSRTQPICACRGGNTSGLCQAITCYAGPGFNPCPDQAAIKYNQSTIIAWESEIIFYRNWSEAELKDLTDEINIVLNDQIRFYQESADAEVVNTTRDRLEEKVQEKTEERRLKQLLAENLESLIGLNVTLEQKMFGEAMFFVKRESQLKNIA